MKNKPRLSIGLPVYNGEKFLRPALDSLLNQTFQDFELIISDNASTDATEAICQEYADKDSRIRYYRNPDNVGCARNFNYVLELASCEYFKWVAYDDLHDSTFIEKCINILDQDPNLILCHSQVQFIDETGRYIQDYNIHIKANLPKAHQRFSELITKHLCYQCYGVIRTKILKNAPRMGSYGAADAIFLLRLALFGRFYEIPEYLFFARHHSQQSLSMFFPEYMSCVDKKPQKIANKLPDFYAYAEWFDTNNKGKLLFPHWRILGEYLRSAWMGKMEWYERLICYFNIIKKLSGTETLLIKDLIVAIGLIWQHIPRVSVSVKVEIRRPSVSI
ncbi:glycosyltransferase family 2 protein [Calothrix sp. PCC 6303]|uniref:glycosyltransferase family 2 protein n=1 Tax=Calothrix sp. PCC 6303 TaxID=1170562 RepID=UPI0002A00487|nr:glycosyltransferase family 2 protein [Calothrix sp. PCC 6303]AFZ00756.1 glycosyl transferase family 2 [Calothrix sp. PCC 6303]